MDESSMTYPLDLSGCLNSRCFDKLLKIKRKFKAFWFFIVSVG